MSQRLEVARGSFDGKRLRGPSAPSARHRTHVRVAHFGQIVCGERRSKPAAAVEDDVGACVRDGLLDVAFDDALAQVACALDVARLELALLPDVHELEAIADFAYDRLAAKVWNLYFLVPTGRGQFVSDITPAQYDEVLASLAAPAVLVGHSLGGLYQCAFDGAGHYLQRERPQPVSKTIAALVEATPRR